MDNVVLPSWACAYALGTVPPVAGVQAPQVEPRRLPRITLLDLKLRDPDGAGDGTRQPRWRLHVENSETWLGYVERRGGTTPALNRLLLAASDPGVRPPWVNLEDKWEEMAPSGSAGWWQLKTIDSSKQQTTTSIPSAPPP